MRRHPIKDHTNAAAMKRIYQVAKIIGAAEARGRRKISAHLIAPGAGERMLHNGHQLDVREPHIRYIVDELLSHLTISKCAVLLLRHPAPGSEVDFVNRQRRAQGVALSSRFQPGVVAELIFRLEYDRSS